MNTIKKISFGVISFVATAPAAALAQFTIPDGTGLPASSVSGIILNTMNYLLMLIGLLGVIGFVIAGIFYLTAAGDEGRIEKGKSAMINSIIGIVVALLGVIILQAVKGFLGSSKTF